MATMTATTQPMLLDHRLFMPKSHRAIKTETARTYEPAAKTTHRALTVNPSFHYEFSETPRPTLGSHEVLLRTKYVGLNAIDWKTVEYKFCMPSLPWINGRECSAVVEECGSAVLGLKKGQRVWTSTYYRDRRAGCFQDLVVVPEHTVIPIPENVGFDGAACLGVAGLTAAMTMWKWLGVPMHRTAASTNSSSTPPEYALIWGGSTVTGQFAIQIALEAGLRVIAITSQRTRQKVLDLGAHHVVVRDGRSLDYIASEIRRLGGDDIVLGVDLVGPKTAAHGVQCLSRSRPARFAPLAVPAPPIDAPGNVEIVNVEMKRFVLDPTSRQYGVRLTELVAEGKVKLPECVVLSGGLSVVEKGLRRLKEGDMGGQKMVVRM